MESVLNALSEYIREEVGYNGDLNPDIDLLEARILDSFSVVEIASYIQTNFDVELDPEDLTRENFTSLSNMASLIDRRAVDQQSE